MKILVLDNYDSFTYNLVHILARLGFGEQTDVFRNDKIRVEEVRKYDKILLSPGPGIPDEAGVMKDLVRIYAAEKSILGVCLGHQGIAEVFGAKLYNLDTVLHGIKGTVTIKDKEDPIFRGLPPRFDIGHYHSWVVNPATLNGSLMITATDDHGLVMGIRHREYDVEGVQFHPESILTEFGEELIMNWLTN